MNFVRTDWDEDTSTFVKKTINYPLGKIDESDYYGEPIEVPFENLNKHQEYPDGNPGAGRGIPSADDVPTGWTGVTTTGPVAPITKRRVVGLAVYPQAVSLSQEYSNMVTDEGKTRGQFTEVC